jgi:hypothetical protein
MAANAITKFIAALQSLVRQGLSKQAAEQFAKNEFGEISKFLQKRIDDVYKNPKGEGIESIKIKDEVFDDTVIKLPIDDTGQPFNPNNPLKQYGKPKKAGKGQFTKAEYLIQRLKNTIKENPDDKYVQENFPNFVKEIEANPDLAKNENVFRELGGDLPSNQKITVYDDDTLDFARLKPTKKFQLNKERFQKDFNVADDEVERIIKLSSEDQQKELQKYINKDFKERIELSDYDITDLEPNAEGGIVGYYTGGMVDVEPNLSDIGHGSDSLMARTRLISPNNQATTSTGLNYLLAEDNDNIRVPFAKGKGVDLLRRGFLKTMGAAGAGIAALKSGILSLGGKQATKEVAKELITTPAAAGKPAWFDALVTRVVNEGEDVTKKFATKDREIVHATKVDDDAMVTVYRDLDDGTVRVDIDDATTNVMGEQGDSVVSLEVRGGQLEEGVKGKTPVEFEAREADYRNYMDGPDDYTTETIDNVVGDTKDLTADLTKVKMYAKGQKKPTIKEMMIQRDRAKTLKQAEENPAEYAADRGPDIDTKDYDYASGGIARMIGE